jgi:hypothetical protein
MLRFRLLAVVAALAAASAVSSADDKWVTIKGQVVFPAGKDIPKPGKLDVTQDKEHCLKDGDILDQSIIVNPANRGVKNVVVWLRPADKNPKAKFEADQIHPDDAKRKPAEVSIDQPCCMFIERITTARPGDTLVVKNSAPVPHNFFWSSSSNGEYNVTIPKMDKWTMPEKIVAEGPPIQYKCTIHGWMTGYVRIFDHPYYAVTDKDGKFEIKNAPAGDFRIVYWHEASGFRGGVEGRFGEEVTIKGPALEMKPTEFDVTPKK